MKNNLANFLPLLSKQKELFLLLKGWTQLSYDHFYMNCQKKSLLLNFKKWFIFMLGICRNM